MNYLDEDNPRLKNEDRPNKREGEVYRKTYRNFCKIVENTITPELIAKSSRKNIITTINLISNERI